MARIFAAEIRAEFLKLARTPTYAIATLAFPMTFYFIFGVLVVHAQRDEVARYVLGSMGAYGAIGTALFGFGVGVANERAQGWLAVKLASPMPPGAYVLAKTVACLAFAGIVSLGVCALAAFVAHVSMPIAQWLALLAILVFGTIPFCAIGLALGAMVPADGAVAIVNLVYLPASFLSGLWIPLDELPASVRAFAPVLPTYHLGALAHGAVGFPDAAPWTHVAALALWAALATAIASRALSRTERLVHG